MGQEDAPAPKLPLVGPAPNLKLRATSLSPQAMLRAMLAQERASRTQAGATVEVIGYEEEPALKLLSFDAAEHTRLNFHIMDTQAQRELYGFMHQDPSHPAPVMFIPKVAGGLPAKTNAEWLK
jgi:hypothetical protein